MQRTSRRSTSLPLAAALILGLGALAASPGWAQQAGKSAALPEAKGWASPKGIALLFEEACLHHEGQAAGAVDWALSQGFEPVDPMRGSTEGLLDGKPGSVLAAPNSDGRVMLAAGEGQRCTVWAERTNGPALRVAVAEMLAVQFAKGAKVQHQVDRNMERAGAWRNQMQWRYKAVGVIQEFGLGAVTTLSPAPGTQALHMGPVVVAPGFAPDGVPAR